MIDRHIDDVSRDTGSDDEIAKALFLENVTGVLGLINDTIGCEKGGCKVRSIPTSEWKKKKRREHTINLHLPPILLNRSLHQRFRNRHPSIRHKNIQSSKIPHNPIDRLLHPFRIRYFQLIGFDLHVMQLCEFETFGYCFGVGIV